MFQFLCLLPFDSFVGLMCSLVSIFHMTSSILMCQLRREKVHCIPIFSVRLLMMVCVCVCFFGLFSLLSTATAIATAATTTTVAINAAVVVARCVFVVIIVAVVCVCVLFPHTFIRSYSYVQSFIAFFLISIVWVGVYMPHSPYIYINFRFV